MRTLSLLHDAERLDIDDVKRNIRDCVRCPHRKFVYQTLPGYGAEDAPIDVLVFGQYPGQKEDKIGRPLSLEAGKFIRQHFYDIGLTDKNIFWSNIVCCPPPLDEDGKADLTKEQVSNCSDHIEHLIDALQPKVIVGLGGFVKNRMFSPKHMASQTTNKAHLLSVRFNVWDYRGYPLVMMTNPAVCLRSVGFERENMEEDIRHDFEFLRKVCRSFNILGKQKARLNEVRRLIGRKGKIKTVFKRKGE